MLRDIIRSGIRFVGAAIDATGMGMNLAEDLGREFGIREDSDGAGLIWQVTLSTTWYNEHMPPLKTAFEDGTIALAADPEHVMDLRLVKIVRGIPSIPAEREGEKGAKRHGDFAVALALAHFATKMEWREFAYRTAQPKPSRFEERAGPADESGWSDRPDERSGRFRMASLRRSRGLY